MTTQEAAARLTASAYEYMKRIENGCFFLKEEKENKMAEEFDSEKFFCFRKGLGFIMNR